MTYTLYYWPGIPGRGEFIRLPFEASRTAYHDMAEEDPGQVSSLLRDASVVRPSFAPPYLHDSDADIWVGQVATILRHIGPKIGLAAESHQDRLWVDQVQQTIDDFVLEAHDVHHPLGAALPYEDQKPESARRAELFRAQRIPKFLDWFETILSRNPAGSDFLVGDGLSYADTSLFQTCEGIRHAFPNAMAAEITRAPKVTALIERVRNTAPVSDYLGSARRRGFSNGLFRHYPELDPA